MTDGPAETGPSSPHTAPEGADDLTVEAVGKLTEALERTHRARGHLYAFHQDTGHADFQLDEAVGMLRRAGHHELADRIDRELVGRNVIEGRWTFQIVEDYDAHYYECFVDLEKEVRDRLLDGRPHVYEARLKQQRRTHGDVHHSAGPQ